MSRAFVKDGDEAGTGELPDRLISDHRNLVTAAGLAAIDAALARADRAHADAVTAADRQAIADAARELRYWNARRVSAELVEPPPGASEVHFGSRVTIRREDGRTHTYAIVGEDEADPGKGTLSYVSPLARAVMGKSVGDVVRIPGGDAEVVGIE